ncbi:MAG: hypothetical protein GXO57_09085 [Thermodesulfobacteria bacterium]|nr:hypothetical protein [Thermodesulfobacteriota bacterium]
MLKLKYEIIEKLEKEKKKQAKDSKTIYGDFLFLFWLCLNMALFSGAWSLIMLVFYLFRRRFLK